MTLSNQEIARKLQVQASELAHKGDNLYRVRAFRQAAMAVMALDQDVAVLVAASGPDALERVPGVGKSLAETIAGYLSAA